MSKLLATLIAAAFAVTTFSAALIPHLWSHLP